MSNELTLLVFKHHPVWEYNDYIIPPDEKIVYDENNFPIKKFRPSELYSAKSNYELVINMIGSDTWVIQ